MGRKSFVLGTDLVQALRNSLIKANFTHGLRRSFFKALPVFALSCSLVSAGLAISYADQSDNSTTEPPKVDFLKEKDSPRFWMQVKSAVHADIDQLTRFGLIEYDFSELTQQLETAAKKLCDPTRFERCLQYLSGLYLSAMKHTVRITMVKTIEEDLKKVINQTVLFRRIQDMPKAGRVVQYYKTLYNEDVGEVPVFIVKPENLLKSKLEFDAICDAVYTDDYLFPYDITIQKGHMLFPRSPFPGPEKITVTIAVKGFHRLLNLSRTRVFGKPQYIRLSSRAYALEGLAFEEKIVHELRHFVDFKKGLDNQLEPTLNQKINLAKNAEQSGELAKAFDHYKTTDEYKMLFDGTVKGNEKLAQERALPRKTFLQVVEDALREDFIERVKTIYSYLFSDGEQRAFKEAIRFLKDPRYGNLKKLDFLNYFKDWKNISFFYSFLEKAYDEI